MPEKEKTCAFTGHRPGKLPWGENETDASCLVFKQTLYDTVHSVYDGGIRHYICGMANGCDLYFAEAVLELRGEKPDVTLEAAIPYEGQSNAWNSATKERYFKILENCDMLTVVQQHYSPACMQRRNEYMVDCSGVLIAAYNGSSGGTRNTLLYAMRQNIHIIEIELDSANAVKP